MGNVHFSSDRHDWATPRDFFERLHSEFRFTGDVCATAKTRCLPEYFGPDHTDPNRRDALGAGVTWFDRSYMNPVYGREIVKWCSEAAIQTSLHGVDLVVGLLPARTDTKWFHQWVWGHAKAIRLILGRLKFDDQKHSAPFPSCLAIWTAGERYTAYPHVTTMAARV